MTPKELSERLRRLQMAASQMPAVIERTAQAQVIQGIPRTVSVVVARQPEGVHITLAGRGARTHARRIAPRLREAAQTALRAGVKW